MVSWEINAAKDPSGEKVDKDQDGQDPRPRRVHEPAQGPSSTHPSLPQPLHSAQLIHLREPQSVVYLGTEWANNPVIKSDIGVAHFLDSVGGYRHAERRDMLLDLLDVDLDW